MERNQRNHGARWPLGRRGQRKRERQLKPEMWTIIGVGIGLAGLGTGGFTLLWRYIAAAEKRSEDRSAAIEKRAEARFAELKADLGGVKADLKADMRMIVDRMERNHADLRHAIDNLILTDQAKRLTILEEAVLRTARPPDDREAQH